MILSNLTIDKVACDNVFDILKKNNVVMTKIVDVLCNQDEIKDVAAPGQNEKKLPKLHYLGPFLSNLSQLSEVREEFLIDSCRQLKRLLPFTEYSSSSGT